MRYKSKDSFQRTLLVLLSRGGKLAYSCEIQGCKVARACGSEIARATGLEVMRACGNETRVSQRVSRRYVALASLRMLFYLLLAFSLVFGLVPEGFADEGAEGGGAPETPTAPVLDPAPDPAPTPDPTPDPTPVDPDPTPVDPNPTPVDPDPTPVDPDPQPTTSSIVDVGIYYHDTDQCLATSINHNIMEATITAKGGQIEFDNVVFWSPSGDQNRNYAYVDWTSSNPEIAYFNANSGTLVARGNGDTVIRATVTSGTQNAVFAETVVHVYGQDDDKYVQAIRILAPDGSNITDGIYELKESLQTSQAQFMAEVDVLDNATGSVDTVLVNGNRLSSIVPGLGDLKWGVGDPNLASVIEETGLYRPSKYGMVALWVQSAAGVANSMVTASTIVSSIDPDATEQEDGYHPQDSLTVKAYYEEYAPSEYGDQAYVINKTYSVGDMQALGLYTMTYTAIGNGGKDFYTMRGTGTPFSTVLRDAGINLDGVRQFAFQTADWPTGENRPVTPDFVFADRYYYPEFYAGSFANAQQVFPILAVESNQIRNSGDVDKIPMTESTRFRLLFGSTPAGGVTSYQIKWINTVIVKLVGAPPSKDDNEEGGGGNQNPEGSGSGDGGAGGSGGGTNAGQGEGSAVGAGAVGGEQQGGSGGANDAGSQNTSNATGGVLGADAGSQNVAYNVYEVLNKDASEVDTPFVPGNPWKPIVIPLGCLALAAGCVESFMWFRFQTAATGTIAHAAVA